MAFTLLDEPSTDRIQTRRDARIEVVSGDHDLSFVVEEPTPFQVSEMLVVFLRLNGIRELCEDEGKSEVVFNNTTFVKDA